MKIYVVALTAYLVGCGLAAAQDVEIGGGSTAGPTNDGIQGGPMAGQIASEDGEGAGGMSLLTKLPVHLSLFTQDGYDNNSSLSSTGTGSWFTRDGLKVFYNLPSQRTHLDTHAGADFTYYPDRTSGKSSDINSYLDIRLNHPVSTRLKLTASVDARYRTEPDFSTNVGVANQRTNYFYTSDKVAGTYDWTSRFATVTSDAISAVQYESSAAGNFSNRFENTLGEEFRFSLVQSDLTLVGEYRFQSVNYETVSRDSTTHYALGGFDKTFNTELRATIRAGATFRSYTDDGDRTDPHVETSLHYQGAHALQLTWTTSYGIEESGMAGVSSQTTFRTGLLTKYKVSSRINATVTGFYFHADNNVSQTTSASSGSSHDGVDLSASLRYAIKGFLTADITYQHSQESGNVNQDYSRDRYSAGLTFTY
ncbi:MAG TPA: hypothetical protein VLK33_18645 [Terriglobales bacterium]|nr:hypothetical protein [Terriglobales bacterium]